VELRKQSGVMLLEALIGVLIFSVGILAMIGMQAASIKNTADATYRSEASYLANQILGQMWADQANLASYSLNPTANTTSPPACPSGTSTSSYASVSNWLTNDVARLPGSSGLKQSIAINGSVVTVTLCWQAPNESVKHNFVAAAQIN
jgi:type IV pilus assembly protein PilV